MFDGRLGSRVSKLETNLSALTKDLGEVRDVVGGLGGKIDKLVDGLSSTDDKAAGRAQAVKGEMREETDRKSKERSSMVQIGIGILGAIGLIVTALTGPWKEKLETTATGQIADTASISAVREVLAQQGAAIGRNQDTLEINREKNRLQDQQLRDEDEKSSYMAGWMTAKFGYPGR